MGKERVLRRRKKKKKKKNKGDNSVNDTTASTPGTLQAHLQQPRHLSLHYQQHQRKGSQYSKVHDRRSTTARLNTARFTTEGPLQPGSIQQGSRQKVHYSPAQYCKVQTEGPLQPGSIQSGRLQHSSTVWFCTEHYDGSVRSTVKYS
ncbi:46 kDa FK506-binding nuclear protein X3 [Biomphalaria glabrata]|nr:46 kDa FK506-binding nuclear protein X3 [Biomphalaria glabrata]